MVLFELERICEITSVKNRLINHASQLAKVHKHFIFGKTESNTQAPGLAGYDDSKIMFVSDDPVLIDEIFHDLIIVCMGLYPDYCDNEDYPGVLSSASTCIYLAHN